ncbi:sensor domain-containing diguanylate cyclase [Demequina activiva]|uniref:GGDEF domain-containing protein n=1 Tax=Demequina activiva TaxID=1582364 RepID=A0A919UJF7_9MICO|nr:sensor domain-containing diguanylate cyclase [Demequina activiva]GIG54326.1 hypothetical protein Dac01nite_10780 [Demequina activiva]
MSSPPQRLRRLSRSRGFLIAAAMVITILILQIVTTIAGVLAVTRQADAAAIDTYGYVGDLTAERVARYVESASDVTEGTAVQIEREQDISMDRLATAMYLRLEREPTVRSLYVGWADGSFLVVRRDGSGFDVQQRSGPPGQLTSSGDYDSQFTMLGEQTIESEYDPRARPWYKAGVGGSDVSWTDPYLQFGSDETLVSAARAARGGEGLIAVAGADLELVSLGQVLDDLPLGEGADAYVLSRGGVIIAVPSGQLREVEEISARYGKPARAEDLDLQMAPPPLEPGQDYISEDGLTIVLERTLEPAADLDWVLHLNADASQLSQGLSNLTGTVVVITAFSVLITIVAILLALRVWRPLRSLRQRAATDQLTGLANRHEYLRRGTPLVERAIARGDMVIAVVVDLDNFKRLNDTYGHETGDLALETVALSLRANIRASDIAARTGGDEFVVVQVLSPGGDAHAIVSRLRDEIEHDLHARVDGGEAVGVTAGFAVAQWGDRLDGLVARADAALIEGKQAVKGRVYAS